MFVSVAAHRVIADLLTARTGQELSESRQWRIATVLAGVLRRYGLADLDQLVLRLARSDGARVADQVVEALLNNETYFFRDRQTYDVLAQQVLPELAEKRARTKRLAIWSAGCSTGQEALSLAILFAEEPERWADWQIAITGTDISDKAITAARAGKYSQFEIQRGLSVAQMLEYFSPIGDRWEAHERLTRMISFRQQNLLEINPAASFDLILCRNVLIYFDQAHRIAAFDRLRATIADDGWLMLGAGEATLGQTDRFVGSALNNCLHQPMVDAVGKVQTDRRLLSRPAARGGAAPARNLPSVTARAIR